MSPATPEELSVTSQSPPPPKISVARNIGSTPPHNEIETDTALGQTVSAPAASFSSQDTDDEDVDIDNDKGTDIDPSYTAVIQQGNTERRSTRATRNTAIPHCSLLIQVKRLLQQS